MAEYERHGAELERRWARLTDPDSPYTAIQATGAGRRNIREGARQASANLMALAETLEKSAGLAEEHARRREREGGGSDQVAEELAAARRAHDAAQRARSKAEVWRSLAAEEN